MPGRSTAGEFVKDLGLILTGPGRAGYRIPVLLMSPRRGPLAVAAFSVLLLGWVTAEASPRHRRPHPIRTVQVEADGAGAVIAVEFVGRHRPRVIHSATPVDAVAVRDIDNDGDLDILASSSSDGLVLWRNAGRGRFVMARAPANAPFRPGFGSWLTTRSDRARVSTDADRLEADIPRDSTVQVFFDTIPLVFLADDMPPLRHDRPRSGRAPPPAVAGHCSLGFAPVARTKRS